MDTNYSNATNCSNVSKKEAETRLKELEEAEEISFYKQGDFTDLCAGPHLISTGKVKYCTYKISYRL